MSERKRNMEGKRGKKRKRVDDNIFLPSKAITGVKTSKTLKSILDLRNFSWRNPSAFGVEGWKEGDSCLPQPIEQEAEDCIAAALKVLIQAQMNFLVRGTDQTAPDVSYEQLKHKLIKMPKNDRNITKMLQWIARNGVIDSSDYDPARREIREGARRFYIDWERGLDPKNENWVTDVKTALVCYGLVIAEVPVKEDDDLFDDDPVMVTDKPHDGKVEPDLAHAICLTGWKTTLDGVQHLEFLNSYGPEWKDGGYGDVPGLNDLFHWAYVPVVKKWF